MRQPLGDRQKAFPLPQHRARTAEDHDCSTTASAASLFNYGSVSKLELLAKRWPMTQAL